MLWICIPKIWIGSLSKEEEEEVGGEKGEERRGKREKKTILKICLLQCHCFFKIFNYFGVCSEVGSKLTISLKNKKPGNQLRKLF